MDKSTSMKYVDVRKLLVESVLIISEELQFHNLVRI
jgi:hypothetical protein